jgi:argininosuccinate lyase
MPHKKNPDVFELTRAKCNKLQSLPQQIMMIANNLPSGYFRDLQIIKEVFLPAFQELKDCLQMTTYIEICGPIERLALFAVRLLRLAVG